MGKGLCAYIAAWCVQNDWISATGKEEKKLNNKKEATGKEEKKFNNKKEAQEFIKHLLDTVEFTAGDAVREAGGERAIHSLNSKLRAAHENITACLELRSRDSWLSTFELAVVVHKLLCLKATEKQTEKKPFVLWEFQESKDGYAVALHSSKKNRFILKTTMMYDEYLEIVQNPKTVHIAFKHDHFGQVLPCDIETVYWLPTPKWTRMRRSLGQSTRSQDDNTYNVT